MGATIEVPTESQRRDDGAVKTHPTLNLPRRCTWIGPDWGVGASASMRGTPGA